MFKRKKKDEGIKGIQARPNSNVPGCFGGIILSIVVIIAFLNLTEVIKWVGQPFLILPDALGLIDRPSKDEVVKIVGTPDSTFQIELKRVGSYNVFLNTWDNWEPGPSIRLSGEDGPVDLEFSPRGARPYDSPFGRGYVEYRFEIDEPGQYTVGYGRMESNSSATFEIALVPDYVSGNEATIRWAFIIQIGLILGITAVVVYFRKIRPARGQLAQKFKVQGKKRDTMDDFFQDLNKDKDD